MQVIQCDLFRVLPEEVIATSIFLYVVEMVSKRTSFLIKSVPEWEDPGLSENWLIWYHPSYEVVYISDLWKDTWRTEVHLDTKTLMYKPNRIHFSQDRDSVSYISPHTRYIRWWYREVIEEFLDNQFILI